MARRNTLRLDTSGFEELITKLDAVGGGVQKAVTDALLQAAETVRDDTVDAMAAINLPAQGKYSTGDTMRSIVEPAVTWSGTVAETPVGFDFSKPGAGGFLISGTPRMQPNPKLEEIYTRKRYMNALQQDMQDVITDYIIDKMEG